MPACCSARPENAKSAKCTRLCRPCKPGFEGSHGNQGHYAHCSRPLSKGEGSGAICKDALHNSGCLDDVHDIRVTGEPGLTSVCFRSKVRCFDDISLGEKLAVCDGNTVQEPLLCLQEVKEL